MNCGNLKGYRGMVWGVGALAMMAIGLGAVVAGGGAEDCSGGDLAG